MNRRMWWLSPISLILFVLIVVILAYSQDAGFYMQYKMEKYINIKYLLISFASVFVFIAGIIMSRYFKTSFNKQKKLNMNLLINFSFVLSVLIYFAYFIWFFNFIRIYGTSVFSIIIHSFYYGDFTNNKGSIDGITTMTQFAVIVVPINAILIKNGYCKRKKIVSMFFMFILALIRTYIFSERLALVELIVTLFITLIIMNPNKKIYTFIPIIAILGIFVIFAFFEYFRSWNYYKDTYDNYLKFAYDRFIAYYSLAINTNSLFLNKSQFYFPVFSFEFLLKIPFLSSIFSNNIEKYNYIFEMHANKEYNNVGGVLGFFLDFNIFSFVIIFILGIIVGHIYHRLKNGTFFAFDVVCYSVIVLTIIELPRYYYLGYSRGFYPLIGLIILYFLDVKKYKIRT